MLVACCTISIAGAILRSHIAHLRGQYRHFKIDISISSFHKIARAPLKHRQLTWHSSEFTMFYALTSSTSMTIKSPWGLALEYKVVQIRLVMLAAELVDDSPLRLHESAVNAAHLFLQRILYRINRLNLFWCAHLATIHPPPNLTVSQSDVM